MYEFILKSSLKVRKEMLQKHCEQKTVPHLIQCNLNITKFVERMKNL